MPRAVDAASRIQMTEKRCLIALAGRFKRNRTRACEICSLFYYSIQRLLALLFLFVNNTE